MLLHLHFHSQQLPPVLHNSISLGLQVAQGLSPRKGEKHSAIHHRNLHPSPLVWKRNLQEIGCATMLSDYLDDIHARTPRQGMQPMQLMIHLVNTFSITRHINRTREVEVNMSI